MSDRLIQVIKQRTTVLPSMFIQNLARKLKKLYDIAICAQMSCNCLAPAMSAGALPVLASAAMRLPRSGHARAGARLGHARGVQQLNRILYRLVCWILWCRMRKAMRCAQRKLSRL